MSILGIFRSVLRSFIHFVLIVLIKSSTCTCHLMLRLRWEACIGFPMQLHCESFVWLLLLCQQMVPSSFGLHVSRISWACPILRKHAPWCLDAHTEPCAGCQWTCSYITLGWGGWMNEWPGCHDGSMEGPLPIECMYVKKNCNSYLLV